MVDIDKFICSLLEHTKTYLSTCPDDAIKLALEDQGIVYKNNHLEGIGNNFNPSIIVETKPDIKVEDMTTEEKDLLRKDLCARFDYDVIVSVTEGTIKFNAYIESISHKNIQVSPVSDSNFTAYTFYKISEIKPYIRPMSSMTDEEREEARELFFMNSDNFDIDDVGEIFTESQPFESVYTLSLYRLSNYIDWLNAHHFDYRGLIEKGLALEAPEGMYNLKSNNYGND